MENKCLNPNCNHEWFQRNDNRPKVCPRCKNYNWDNEEHFKSKTQLNKQEEK